MAVIVDLYFSIPYEAGLKGLRKVLYKREEHVVPTNELIRMADFVLKNGFFEFSRHKKQISRTAIGTKFGPHLTLVCLWINLKLLFLKPNNYSLWCGLDIIKIFFIWTHGGQRLQAFLHNLNEFQTDIKFTYESRKESIAFFDLKVNFKNSKIITDLYFKSADHHQYLHYLPAHRNHTKRAVVFSQTLRVSRLCFYEENFIKYKANIKPWFLKREYPEKLLSAKMDQVKFSSSERKNNSKIQKGITLVVLYHHPLLKLLSSIANSNIYLLHVDQEITEIFTPQPMVSYRSSRGK